MTVFPFDITKIYCPYCLGFVKSKRWTIGGDVTFNYECLICGKEFRLIDIVVCMDNSKGD